MRNLARTSLVFKDYEKGCVICPAAEKANCTGESTSYPANILVLDEPTNHLDNAMSEWLRII